MEVIFQRKIERECDIELEREKERHGNGDKKSERMRERKERKRGLERVKGRDRTKLNGDKTILQFTPKVSERFRRKTNEYAQ